jgi:hypothetical protein
MAYLTGSSACPAFLKLMQALGIPDNTMKACLIMDAGDLVTLRITRALTTEDVEALADVFLVEDLEAIPAGTTVYNFKPRSEAVDDADPAE